MDWRAVGVAVLAVLAACASERRGEEQCNPIPPTVVLSQNQIAVEELPTPFETPTRRRSTWTRLPTRSPTRTFSKTTIPTCLTLPTPVPTPPDAAFEDCALKNALLNHELEECLDTKFMLQTMMATVDGEARADERRLCRCVR